MNLIDRIDIALKAVGKSRSDLAKGLGLSTQAISNLKRREDGVMKPDNVAKASRILGCDLYWLCTGEGGEYVPATRYSIVTESIATWVESMTEQDRMRVYAIVRLCSEGHWPAFDPKISGKQ